MEKAAENGRKVNAIALLSCCFFPLSKIEKSAKNGRKVEEIFAVFTFAVFCLFFKN